MKLRVSRATIRRFQPIVLRSTPSLLGAKKYPILAPKTTEGLPAGSFTVHPEMNIDLIYWVCRCPVHKSLGHSLTAGAFDKHLSPQSKRQHDRMGEGPSLLMCTDRGDDHSSGKYQIIWGRSVQANISFHINGCHGDTYKDLVMVRRFAALKEAAAEVKRNCDPLFVLGSLIPWAPVKQLTSFNCSWRTYERPKVEPTIWRSKAPMWFWVKVRLGGSEHSSIHRQAIHASASWSPVFSF